MKKIFALMLAPVVLLLILMSADGDRAASPTEETNRMHFASVRTDKPEPGINNASSVEPIAAIKAERTSSKKATEAEWINARGTTPTDDLIAYALTLMGTPYKYGGTSDSGFDCSGFTSHVYQEFDVLVTRSSTTQSEDGQSVSRDEARPGDLVIFTGTDPKVREPGHVGIVISEPGDTISFVHSSSNGGVKISQVEGTGYDVRFLDVRRVM
ncbi:C40 family peptidase [Pontibacter sp. HSC-36F09]|uniref:C40 family peptidase n=1 Tax=Pontibacter sp. HSC-36F09 TaxID=2910966 RepID=UPI00209D57AB|nr:C40 family peptidase [Pontibacter sp. HSC-36F09]MCP2045165.1 cell wall-associated NlpC family hydrolase [Pontibacter sp. HSC-36F09]